MSLRQWAKLHLLMKAQIGSESGFIVCSDIKKQTEEHLRKARGPKCSKAQSCRPLALAFQKMPCCGRGCVALLVLILQISSLLYYSWSNINTCLELDCLELAQDWPVTFIYEEWICLIAPYWHWACSINAYIIKNVQTTQTEIKSFSLSVCAWAFINWNKCERAVLNQFQLQSWPDYAMCINIHSLN